MCFSAGASFGASVVLGTIGVVSLKKVEDPRQRAFAAIPVMFAVQQLSEGALWVALADPAHTSWQDFPLYVFLVFAQIIWPVWIPFSVLIMEKDPVRKRILTGLLSMGLLISIYLLYCLFAYPVFADIQAGHIRYTLNFPLAVAWISSVLYFIPTVISLFVSGVRRIPLLGAAILLSFMATKIFFEDHLISVWCFFAAVLSVVVLGIISSYNRSIAPSQTG